MGSEMGNSGGDTCVLRYGIRDWGLVVGDMFRDLDRIHHIPFVVEDRILFVEKVDVLSYILTTSIREYRKVSRDG